MKFLSNRSVTQKIVFFSGFLLVMLSGSTGYLYREMQHLGNELNVQMDVDMPAIHKATLVDMFHDGLRANSLNAIIAVIQNDDEQKKAVADELKEMGGEFRKNLDLLSQLELNASTRNTIAELRPNLEAYIAGAEDVVGTAFAKGADPALKKLPEFQAKFEVLEKDLSGLQDLITAQLESDGKRSIDIKNQTLAKARAILLLGLLLGLGFGWLLIRDLKSKMRTVVDSLRGESSGVNLIAQKISQDSSMLSASSQQQAAAIQETAASVEEISAMVKKTSENSISLGEAAEQSRQSAHQGREAVTKMLDAIDQISESNTSIVHQVEAGNQRITEIVSLIGEIGNKTKVINDIVFQTKLLSFNASVEAARAGEHGKGFAVVAEEVGNLAQMSGVAAKEISELLDGSTGKVQAIVDETRRNVENIVSEGKRRMEQGTKVAQQCGNSLENISQQVETVNKMIHEISTAIHEQTQGITEISNAIAQLDSSTQANAKSAEGSSVTSQDLLHQAETVREIVNSLEISMIGKMANSESLGEKPAGKVLSLNYRKAKGGAKSNSAGFKKAVGE